MAANQANLDAPILPPRPAFEEFTAERSAIESPPPSLGGSTEDDTPEFEQPTAEAADADGEPQEVSGDEGALASASKRRVVRRR